MGVQRVAYDDYRLGFGPPANIVIVDIVLFGLFKEANIHPLIVDLLDIDGAARSVYPCCICRIENDQIVAVTNGAPKQHPVKSKSAKYFSQKLSERIGAPIASVVFDS